MDECGFDFGSTRGTRRVGPCNAFIKAQSCLLTSTHITVIAAISTQDAPVPPFLLYSGKYLMTDWPQTLDSTPRQVADVTDLGFSCTYMTICWLTEVFDPATKNRANGSQRLIFLDGPVIHTSVDFLDACWDRQIVCIILLRI